MENSQDSPSQGSSRLAWFFAGAGVGAAVALLFAPAAGRQTRTLISQKAQEGVDRSRDMVERGRKLVDDATDMFERGRRLARGDEPA